MQDSIPFQYIAIDQLFESKTNPRQTFDQTKLEELAASIKHHGLIQPIVVRPKDNGFEVVAGDQLDLQAMHRIRDRLVSRRTAVINQIRAFLLERGMWSLNRSRRS